MTDARETIVATSKICTSCNVDHPLSAYHRATGNGYLDRAAVCKKCFRVKYAKTDLEKRRTPEGRATLREQKRRRDVTDASRARERRSSKSYAHRYPEKEKAKREVRSALERGHLVRPTTCSQCGKESPPNRAGVTTIHAHHHDYSKPLDVTWVCILCHANEHRAALQEGKE